MLLAIPKVAHADPHAMFYTAVGQRQLFFNVLSALDQADYVEPADGFDFSRAVTLERRATAKDAEGNDVGFPAEDDPRAAATKTDLSAILSRGITLEGQDLWTSYLLHQSALEFKRREELNKLLSILCNVGFGACGGEKDEQQAFVTDIQSRPTEVVTRGVSGALGSNYNLESYDQQRRRDELERENQGGQGRPIAFREDVAELREQTSNDINARTAVERVLAAAGRSLTSTNQIPTNAISSLSIDSETGAVTLAGGSSATRSPFIPLAQAQTGNNREPSTDDYANALGALNTLRYTVQAAGRSGGEQIQSFQNLEEQSGTLADSRIAVDTDDGKTAKGLWPIIRVPVSAVLATVNGIISTIGNAEENAKFAASNYKKETTEIGGECDFVNAWACIKNLSQTCYQVRGDFEARFKITNISDAVLGSRPGTTATRVRLAKTDIPGVVLGQDPPDGEVINFGGGDRRVEWVGPTHALEPNESREYAATWKITTEQLAEGEFRFFFKFGNYFRSRPISNRGRIISNKLAISVPRCTPDLAGVSQQNPVSGANIPGSQVAGSSTGQGSVAAGTTSSSNNNGLLNPPVNPVGIHEEPIPQSILDFLTGRRRGTP